MMNKILVIIACIFSIYACGETTSIKSRTKYEYSEDAKPKISKFINACISSGNPKSDEEPEDWIGMCMDKGDEIYGTQIQGFVVFTERGLTKPFTPCAEAKTSEEKEFCGADTNHD